MPAITAGNLTSQTLPPRYYHRHFVDFLAHIQSGYAPVLRQQDEVFIATFSDLDIDAQCLYVRMLNRRGRIFHSQRFNYQEITDPTGALQQLHASGLARVPTADDFGDWLDVLNKAELIAMLETTCSANRFRRSWKKHELSAFARANIDSSTQPVGQAMADYVVQSGLDAIFYLLFLYFGRKEESLQRFTLKDLGVLSGTGFRHRFRPRFTERDVALNNWFYCRKRQQVTDAGEKAVTELAAEAGGWPVALDDDAEMQRQQALYRLGEKAEQYKDSATAELVFTLADGWPASERRARLMYSRGDKNGVERLLTKMIEHPACEEELMFAQDFQERKFGGKRTAMVTDILRQAQILEIDECHRGEPEEAAAGWFRARGAEVWHSENKLWKRLFGLLFWDLLFTQEDAALFNEFERQPADLLNGTFYPRHQQSIEAILAELSDSDITSRKLLSTATRYYARPNGLFRWSSQMLTEVQACLVSISPQGLAIILRRMAQDWMGNRSGYPDLLVIKEGQGKFIEIKTDGDQLRRNQLKQITALERAGIPVAVNRIRWAPDPNQIYAVVDIETTGRRGGSNRITEVGIVRLQGENIIDRWETLVNPCRRIPQRISELTGITDTMVESAPTFGDVAPVIREKCCDAIFVAHNVQFDYGFMVDEFRRLGERFHAPTFCTVRGMRRWYPGLRSYSLKNLCDHLDILLENHHRALNDASAAAQLLNLINRRRLHAN